MSSNTTEIFDLADIGDPIEVWKAVEGDPSDLIALLRSGERISRPIRDALADFLSGELKPVRFSRGRPSNSTDIDAMIAHARRVLGHDVTTSLGIAGYRYERLRRYIRSKGWNRSNPGWSARLKKAVADRQEIELEKFINYLSRSRPKPKRKAVSWDEQVERRRQEIAKQVRARK